MSCQAGPGIEPGPSALKASTLPIVLTWQTMYHINYGVMWSKLLMTSAISCPLWSSVYDFPRVECVSTSPVRTECGMFVMYCMQCCMSVSAVL